MTIRTALIGFGTAGRVFHAPLITSDPRYLLSAIVTSSPGRVEAARAEYPDAVVYPDADALFEQIAGVDLLVIASPNETHAGLARRAIAAGIDLVIDKPIAVTSVEAQEIADEARAAGVTLTVFQNRRWDGDYLTLKGVIESGVLGDIHQFDSSFEWFASELTERWKDTATSAAGGGILYDLAPHLIDQAIELFGEVELLHSELDLRRPGSAADDDAFVTLLHRNGVRSRLWMSSIAPAPRARFRVVGSRAVFESHGLDPQEPQSIAGMTPLDEQFGLHEDGRAATVSSPDGVVLVPLERGVHLEFYRLLANALIDGGAVPVAAEDSIRALKLIEAASV